MAKRIGDNYSLQGKIPNFERDQFQTKQAMLDYNPEEYMDDGHISFCIEDRKHYKWNALLKEWELFTGEGGSGIDSSKFGYSRVIGNIEQYFASKADASLYDLDNELHKDLLLNSVVLPSGGGSASDEVEILNLLPNRVFTTSKDDDCYISFQVNSTSTESDGTIVQTGERVYVVISIQSGSAEYESIHTMYYPTDKQYSFNVAKSLKAGDNRIKIEARGEDSNITAKPLIYTITQTSLSLSAPNFNWSEIFKSDIQVPCIITGNINKLLHIRMIGEDYIYEPDPIILGTTVYTEIAYSCVIPHPKKSGVFDIVLKVTNIDGTIETKPLNFSIICAEENTVEKYIAINNLVSTIKNWSNNNLFEYTCYDGNNSETDIIFNVLKDNVIIKEFEYVVSVGSKQIFNYDLAIETLDNSNFQIQVQIKDADKLYKTLDFNVDNSLGYSAIAGATVYINPKTRSNTQSNRLQVINEITNTPINAIWEGVGWGIDGWTDDGNNHKSLHLIAGSKVVLDYKPFEQECAQIGKTIELYFKISSASAYKNPAISLFEDNKGIQITSDLVYLFSQSSSNIENNSVNFNDGDKIHMAITIGPDVYGINGFNLCVIYINGVKNREFVYTDQDYFAHTGKLTFGCLDSNLDIYGFRSYDFALTTEQIRQNRLNWETSDDVRNTIERRNDIFDAYGSNIDYHKVKNQWNVFVFEGEIPSLNNTGKFKGNLFIEWCNHKDWNSVVHDVTIDGQGTSSKKYYLWNLRWKLKDDTRVTYIKENQTATTGSWIFHPDHPAIKVATAKLNWASSPQSHKIGSVNSINDLAKELNLLPTDKARVAIYMKSFVGFQKTYNEEGEAVYNFLGLYTLGPDKGDEATFDYNFDLYPKLLSLEGSDNAPLPALFRVPWNPNKPYIKYNADEEAFQYNETNSWDFNAGELNNIDTWIAAYNFVYECSNILQPFDGTLEELNEETTLQEYKNKSTELWLSDYNVVYYEAAENKFIYSDTGNGIINLKKQLVDTGYLSAFDLENKTLDEKNTLFINARILKFKSEFENYFDLDDAIFQRNWVEFNAATDNRAKNTYPYIFGLLEEGYRWKWRADDTDTIWPFTNQGQSKKSYEVEVGDKYSDGQPVWNGETSVFWNLLDLAFPQEVFDGMRAMIKAMEDLADNQTGTSLDRIYNFFHKYYFKEAQEYFSEELYNQTAKTLYETAKLAHMNGSYTNDTDPITQSLGDHYSAERRWILKRIPYMLSKYAYGEFSADSTDKIVVRASGKIITYDITPAIWLYPTIMNGTSVVKGKRTKPGETCTIEVDLGGASDQQNAILGPHYIKDIGAWYNKHVNGTMIIVGKMLTNLQIGSETEDIIISISSLTIKQTPALEVLNISRIATLQGTLDLSEAPRLQECYAGGTSLNNIIFSNGGNLQKIVYGSKINYITFKNLPSLQTNNIDISACKDVITDFHIENCPQVNSIQLLYDIYSHQKANSIQNLERIRCTDIEGEVPDGVIDMLVDMEKGGYYGLNDEGILINSLPVLQGHIHVKRAIVTIVDFLSEVFPDLYITYENTISFPPLNIQFETPNNATFYENELIQIKANVVNSVYEGVYYDTLSSDIEVDKKTGIVTLKRPPANDSFKISVTIRAHSKYNTNSIASRSIYIQGIKINSISLSGPVKIKYNDDPKQVYLNVLPENHTKTLDILYTTDNDLLNFNEEDLTISTKKQEEFGVTYLAAYLKADTTIYSYYGIQVNDGIVVTAEENPAFMSAAVRHGWVSNSDHMTLSEAQIITTIPNYAFTNEGNDLTSLDVLQYTKITSIPTDALKYSDNIQSIILPKTYINVYTYKFNNLKTFHIHEFVTKIQGSSSDNPSMLEELIIAEGYVPLTIGSGGGTDPYTILANSNLIKLELPDRPITLNPTCFGFNKKLKTLHLGKNTNISAGSTADYCNPFTGCIFDKITTSENSKLKILESYIGIFNENYTMLIHGQDYIPSIDSLTELRPQCFSCQNLNTSDIILPPSVTRLKNTFYKTNVRSIEFTNTINNDCSFYGMSELETIICATEYNTRVYSYNGENFKNLIIKDSSYTPEKYKNPYVGIVIRDSTAMTSYIATFKSDNPVKKDIEFKNCSKLETIDCGSNINILKVENCKILHTVYNFLDPTKFNSSNYVVLRNCPSLNKPDNLDISKLPYMPHSFLEGCQFFDETPVIMNTNCKTNVYYCFKQTNIQKLIINNHTGYNMFESCLDLKEITVNNSAYLHTSVFYGCVNVNTIIINSSTPPPVQSNSFGTGTNAVGYNNKDSGTNILYVPKDATGFDTGPWLDVLVNTSNFTISYTL